MLAALIAGCGGGEDEAVSAAWCTTTGRIVYLLDQHSTTLTSEELGEWEESTPESMRPTVADAANVLRRYPVDANAPALVEARQTIEAYAEDRCPPDWRGPLGASVRLAHAQNGGFAHAERRFGGTASR